LQFWKLAHKVLRILQAYSGSETTQQTCIYFIRGCRSTYPNRNIIIRFQKVLRFSRSRIYSSWQARTNQYQHYWKVHDLHHKFLIVFQDQ
jgi:hypothetical protein